jgi:DNA polymerase/3'-5' exonuclease PolX
VCNDVDIVCIPRVQQEKDMLGVVTSEKNLVWGHLAAHVAAGKATWNTGGNMPGKFCILQLKKCQLDVYFASHETFATRFLCRTGSKEHNIFLAERAQSRGMKWESYEGLRVESKGLHTGETLRFGSEEDIYAALGLKFIEPKDREQDWINKRLEFGL